MKPIAVLTLIAFACLPVQAATNLPASAILLDEKAVMDLTAGLTQYDVPTNITGKFTTLGSPVATILLNRWASEFVTLYPQVQLNIRPGGSVAGLPELLEGKVDLVPLARPLTEEDAARFKAKFRYPPTQIIVAQDAIGVYVNKNNPIGGITFAQLDAIYSREPKRGGGRPEFWSDLGIAGPLAAKESAG